MFVIPFNAGEEVPADFLAAFGVETTPTEEKPPEEKPPEEKPPEEKPPEEKPASDPDGTPPAEGDPKPQTPEPDQKAAAAFAAMRVENSNYKRMLKDIGGILGIDAVEDPNALATALQTKILEAQAKQQKVPIELLQRMQSLEQENQLAKTERLQIAAYRGFQNVKDKFKLDDKGLQVFATELQLSGINPFAQEIDLVKEYTTRNFEKLLEAAKAEGAKAEAERAAKAAEHGTVPGSGKGQNGGEAGKINTISDLNAWLNKQP